jgi:hypothetical protein
MMQILTLVASLSAFAPAGAQDDEPKKKIQELVGQLGAEEFAVREKATEELRKIGKPAEEALRKAAESDDPEVRSRAKGLLEDLAQAEKPKTEEKPRRGPDRPLPGFGFRAPGRVGTSVQIQSVNGDTTYKLSPGDGSGPITFHKAASGAVKLEYTDDKGAARTAEAETLEKFLKDHKDLAAKYGITEEGIDYGGARAGFKSGFFRNVPRVVIPRPVPLPPLFEDEDEGRVRAAGATFEKPSDALRAQLELPAGEGLVVVRVEEGGLAEAAGLKKNDVLLDVDGKKVASAADVKAALKKGATLTVVRKGKRETLTGSSPPRKDF